MYNVKQDYIARLRYFLLNTTELLLTEDPEYYTDHYDSSRLQGFLVWNHAAYVAKEYEFDDTVPVDFFIIPTFGMKEEKSVCNPVRYIGINVDMYDPIDQTGQRLDLVCNTISTWHRSLLSDNICPITLPDDTTYMILPNGISQSIKLTDQPYHRVTVRYKLDMIHKI